MLADYSNAAAKKQDFGMSCRRFAHNLNRPRVGAEY
jgi:hypothetical protein